MFGETTVYRQNDVYVFERIKTGISKELILKIRAEKNPDEQKRLKGQLPAVNFQGVFSSPSKAGLKEFSGLMILDFDGFESDNELNEMKAILSKDRFTYACFISPRGKGLKLVVKIPIENQSKYKYHFDSLAVYYKSSRFDRACSNVNRTCLDSYDPNIYVNYNAETYTYFIEPEYIDMGTDDRLLPITSDNEIIRRLLVWWRSKYDYVKGQRNTNLSKLAFALNAFGVQKQQALQTLFEVDGGVKKETEINSICNSAYKNISEFGTRFFKDYDKRNKIEKKIRTGSTLKDIAKEMPDVDQEDIQTFVETVVDKTIVDDFWFYPDKKNVRLSPHKFKYYLENNNFSKYFPTSSKTYTFIQIDQKQVEETNEKRIKDFVLSDLLKRDNIGMKPYDFMVMQTKFFTSEFLSFLDSASITIKEDTANECFLYYRNCVVKVTSNSIETIDYMDIEGYIWKNQIIDRDYIACDHHDSEYRRFIWLISGEGTLDFADGCKKYDAFKSAIGYLMHSYKTSENNKAVILNDSVISENPNGRSGKGLFCSALSKLKKLSSIDGKSFDFEKSFPYQTVSTDCQLLVFDDVKRNFAFERLFSLITEGITIEYKGQDAVKLSVQKSPKIIITTNYTIKGEGGSFDGRKYELELSSHFNSNHTPKMEFGRILFDSWDNAEWARFDNYMIQCAQFYLSQNLVTAKFDNIHVRKFINNTSSEFWGWSQQEKNLPLDQKIYTKDIMKSIISDFSDLEKWLKEKRLRMWVNEYVKFHKLFLRELPPSAFGRGFVISKENNSLEENELPQESFFSGQHDNEDLF